MERRWRQREVLQIFVSEDVNMAEKTKSTTESSGITEEEKKLMKSHSKQALSVVMKLHKQLGHPGNDKSVDQSHEGRADGRSHHQM